MSVWSMLLMNSTKRLKTGPGGGAGFAFFWSAECCSAFFR